MAPAVPLGKRLTKYRNGTNILFPKQRWPMLIATEIQTFNISNSVKTVLVIDGT